MPHAGRESDFKKIWKLFPHRPGSPEMEAWEVFQKLEASDVPLALKGAERFAAWFREDAAKQPGKSIEDQLRYVPFLANWLTRQAWHDALKLPVKALPGSEAAAVMAGVEYVHKFSQGPLFAQCEALHGRSVPVGATGKWAFDKELVAEARKQLGQRSGTGPPGRATPHSPFHP